MPLHDNFMQQLENPQSISSLTLEELMNLTITTASKYDEISNEIPASVTVITREDIETFGYQTLLEILQNIPGLYKINDYIELDGSIGIRGYWSKVPNDNVMFQINGVNQIFNVFDNYTFAKMAIPVEAIERIEVIKGPMALNYGNGAFFGIINIFTSDKNHKAYNHVSLGMGSQNGRRAILRLNDSNDLFNYSLNASTNYSRGLDEPYAKMMNNPSLLVSEFNVPVDHSTGGRMENLENYINLTAAVKNFTLDISFTEVKKESNYYFIPLNDGNEQYQTNFTFASKYENKISENLSFLGKLTYSNDQGRLFIDALKEDFYGIQYYGGKFLETEANILYQPSKIVSLTAGLYYKFDYDLFNNNDIPSFGTPSLYNNLHRLADDYIDNRALYCQVKYLPFPSLTFIGGIRATQQLKYTLKGDLAAGTEYYKKAVGTYDREKIDIIPRIALLYSIDKNNTLKFIFSEALNNPSFFQNRNNLLLDPSKGILLPEKIRTYEINFNSVITEDLVLSASYFNNYLSNLIVRQEIFDDRGNYLTWDENTGKLITNGFEIDLRSRLNKNIFLELSACYQKTYEDNENVKNLDFAYSPEILGNIKLSYKISDSFSAGLTANYVASMYPQLNYLELDENNVPFKRIGDKVNGYLNTGLNIRADNILSEGFFAQIKINNLLDQEIHYPTTTNNPWADKGTIDLGLSFFVSAGFKF